MPEWIGKTIGKVRVEKFLARGGMAEVYVGTHLTLDRPVAVKVLQGFSEDDADRLTRFQREAKVVAGLRHPNIVQIFDFDTTEGHPYIVMEYVKGPPLSEYLRHLHLRRERLGSIQVTRLLTMLAAALDYAHEQGVIHRDIKPGNVLLHSKTGELSVDSAIMNLVDPVLTDFGLVRIAHSGAHTTTGVVNGTPAYMSPEQAQGEKVDHRSDIYSLGVVLYEILAGHVPFEGETTWNVILKHINEPPPPIQGIQPAVQKVIDRALAKNPDDRYQSCRALAADYLDAIGFIAEADTLRFSMHPTPQPVPATIKKNPPQRSAPKRLFTFAVTGLLMIALAIIGFSIFRPSAEPPQATEHPQDLHTTVPAIQSTAGPSVFPPIADGLTVGLLRFQNGTAALDQVTVRATLATPPQGTHYEAWLVGGELRRSLGVLELDDIGAYRATFVDPQSRNMLERFDRMEITLEPSPDNNPNPSSQVIYSSTLPASALVHVRHVLISISDTPNETALAHGLLSTTVLVDQSATAMLTAFEANDEVNTRASAEAIINLIAGNQAGETYKDWDGDGTINDPGDGYGLLLNGDQAGYIHGTFLHADYAATTADATSNIQIHATHVEVSTQNMEAWAPQLREIAVRIVQADFGTNMEADVRTAVALASQLLNGLDIDGNESVDPIPGEGGALTVYQHAFYMADMAILPGANQPPAP